MTETDYARAALEVTRKWAIEELKAARARATNLRCGGEAYNTAISAIKDLSRLVAGISYMLGEKKRDFSMPAAPPQVMEDPAEPEIAEILTAAKNDPEPEPEKPARVVDIAEVRTKAKAARDAGVKLAEIWAEFGATKLSEVPHTKYGDVLDLLDAKLKELG